MILDIFQDFLLLENQLQFFVLNKLFEMAKVMAVSDKSESTPTFIGLACNFLAGFDGLQDKIPKDIDSTRTEHFVDLVGIFLTSRERSQPHKWEKRVCKITYYERAPQC